MSPKPKTKTYVPMPAPLPPKPKEKEKTDKKPKSNNDKNKEKHRVAMDSHARYEDRSPDDYSPGSGKPRQIYTHPRDRGAYEYVVNTGRRNEPRPQSQTQAQPQPRMEDRVPRSEMDRAKLQTAALQEALNDSTDAAKQNLEAAIKLEREKERLAREKEEESLRRREAERQLREERRKREKAEADQAARRADEERLTQEQWEEIRRESRRNQPPVLMQESRPAPTNSALNIIAEAQQEVQRLREAAELRKEQRDRLRKAGQRRGSFHGIDGDDRGGLYRHK